jgi:Flp pilus assembly protein protease CpaA
MFYPIQSITYTWNTSKKIYEVFSQYSLTTRWLIAAATATCFSLISIYSSIEFGVLSCLFLWICLIDMYDRIIPDILLVGVLLNLEIIPVSIHPWSLAIAAIIIGLKLALERGYKKIIVGWGDIKLITLCLLFTPLESTPYLLFISGAAGLMMAFITRSQAFPFAPSIITGFLSVLIML